MDSIGIFGAAISFVLVGWALHYIWERQRSSALRQVGEALYLQFSEKDSLSTIPDHDKFPLLTQVHRKKVINRMSGVSSHGEPVLFGYKYTTGSGKNSTTYSQTVAWFAHKKPMPTFEMRPENLFHKIAIDDLRQAIYLDAKYIDAYLLIDYLLAKQSRFEEIIRRWSSYIQKVNTNGRAYLERGGAYFHAGKKDLALADARKACTLGEKHGCELADRY